MDDENKNDIELEAIAEQWVNLVMIQIETKKNQPKIAVSKNQNKQN